jgi:hypothetical protein
MRFYEITQGSLKQGSLKEVSAAAIRNQQTPFYLFMGGLLHLNGLELEGGLANLLQDITKGKLPVYTLAINDTADVSKTALEMHAYNSNRIDTPAAKEIVSHLFIDTDSGQKTQALSNVHFIGYSYGTALIQQIESVLRERIQSKGHVCLESIRCVNVGPVVTPNVTTTQGHSIPYDITMSQPNVLIDQSGRFKQMFFYRTTDKVVGEVTRESLIDPRDTRPHIAYQAPSLVFVVENAGDSYIRRVGIGRYASGMETPRLDFSFDWEGHGLRLYTNELNVTESDKGRFAVFPSSSLPKVIKDAVLSMADRHVLWPKVPDKWIEEGVPSARKLNDLSAIFNDAVREFQRTQYHKSFAFVEGFLADVECMTLDLKQS